jgi:hypothetical protein
MKRRIAAALLASLLAACSTPEQQSALECGGVTAAVAFAACKLAHGNTATCAAIGAGGGALGGAACYGLAKHLDDRRKELAGRENDLDARLQYVRGVNQDSEQYNAQLRKSVSDVTAQTDNTVQQIKQGALTADQIASARQALDKQIADAYTQLSAQKLALQDMKQFQARQPKPSPDLDAEIQKEQSILAATQRDTQALASQRQRI